MKDNKDIHIGFSHFDPRFAFFWSIVGHCAKEEAEQLGVRLSPKPAPTADDQVAGLKSLIKQQVDALLITPVVSGDPGLIAVVHEANAAGIPVIALDSDIGGGQVACTVRSDNVKGEELATEYIFKRLGGQGQVAHLQGDLGVQVGALRSEGFHNVLEQYPHIELVFEAMGDWGRETGAKLTRQALAAHPDIQAVIAGNDLTALGASDAIEEAGRTNQISVAGFDALPEALLALHDEKMTATIRQAARSMARQALEMALRALRRESVPSLVLTEIDVITPDNLLGTAVDGLRMVPSMLRNLTESNEAQQRLQQEIIEAQQRAIEELSTPVIPIMNAPDGGGGIIVMPLIGSIDSLRARDITRSLLAGISRHRAKVVILDVTGVPIMDTGVVNHLNKTIQAARLKGARTIVTGISDAVAETIVDLGIDWSKIETQSDLQTGLQLALAGMGLHIKGKAR
jgi:ribose transport system substrate-binding protein